MYSNKVNSFGCLTSHTAMLVGQYCKILRFGQIIAQFKGCARLLTS